MRAARSAGGASRTGPSRPSAARRSSRRGSTWAPIRTQDETLDDPHLHDRGFWIPVHHPELGRDFLYAGGPFIMPAAPWRFARRPPLVGEHTEEVLAEVG